MKDLIVTAGINSNSITGKIVSDVMRCDEFYVLRNRDKIKSIEKKWLKDLYNIQLDIDVNVESDVLFFRSLVRSDYHKLFHAVISSCNDISYSIVEDYEKTPSLNIESVDFMSKHKGLLALFDIYEIELRIALFIRFIYYFFIANELYKRKFNTIVLFSDMQPVECLASHIGNLVGKETVTLQHGLYIEYEGIETVNVVNYEVQPSKTFLAWGKNTKNLIEKYHSDTRVVICGKPDIDYLTASEETNRKILVVLDQEVFRENNIALLHILLAFCNRNGYSFEVRFHPHNNKASYRKLFSITEQSVQYEHYDFCVGISSSLIYELKSQGLKVFQFSCSTPAVDFPKEFSFSSDIELTRKIQSNFNANFSPISYVGEESTNKYREFFFNLKENSKESTPFFSIIIPTYNSVGVLYKALNSIVRQTCGDYEVIISDGASDDYTFEYVSKAFADYSNIKVYSSPDSGIYDGMNKAFSKVKGQWLIFLGSDDELFDEKVLETVKNRIMEENNPQCKLFYGNVVVSGDVKWAKNGHLYDGEFSVEKIKQKNICHQAIFYNVSTKRGLMPYNTKYKLCSDWDMNLKFFSKYETTYLDTIVAIFNAGGASTEGGDPEFGKDFKSNISKYFRGQD